MSEAIPLVMRLRLFAASKQTAIRESGCAVIVDGEPPASDQLAWIDEAANRIEQLERELAAANKRAHYEGTWHNALAQEKAVLPEVVRKEPTVLPDCMIPDGAEPCKGYLQLKRELAETKRWHSEAIDQWELWKTRAENAGSRGNHE